jgi:hypothetical protein
MTESGVVTPAIPNAKKNAVVEARIRYSPSFGSVPGQGRDNVNGALAKMKAAPQSSRVWEFQCHRFEKNLVGSIMVPERTREKRDAPCLLFAESRLAFGVRAE